MLSYPFIVNCFLNLFTLGMVYIVFRRISNLTQQLSMTPEELYDQVNNFNVSTLERERAFDERIAMLKDEIAMQSYSSVRASSGDAQEMHPMVKNLPHSSIDVNQMFYGEEYAK